MSIAQNFPALTPSLSLDFANVKALDPRITFTRASTAVYYDGVTTAMAEQNLLPYSQEFDNAVWAKTNATISSNTAVAPDGTNTADTMDEGLATALHRIQQGITAFVSGLTYTFSVFVKNGDRSFVQLFLSPQFSTADYANFDISTGVLGTVGGAASATITSFGSGWYRCTITATATSSGTSGTSIGMITSSTSIRAETYEGTSKFVYIWGAQQEQRSAVTAYTPTTTQPITNYIPVLQTAASGAARFDHSPTTVESLGLLIEEQRTNLLTYSEQFDNAAWTKIRASITANTVVSPDGTLDADKLVEDTTANNTHFTNQNVSVAAGAYCFSVYAKKGERNGIALRAQNIAGSERIVAWFNLDTGATYFTSGTGLTATSMSVGNGWYRCTISGSFVSADNALFNMAIGDTSVSENSFGNPSYTGDGYSGIYIWGAQLEAASFATSYIPTVASQVTRAADAASMTGVNFSSWYSGGAGTMYSESAVYASNIKTQVVWDFSGGSTSTSLRSPQAATPNLRATVGGTFSGSGTGAVISNNTFIKATVAWQGLSGRLQSGATGEDVTGAINLDATQLIVGGLTIPGSSSLNGHIRKLSYYPIRVTNTQLQALTS